MNKHPLDVIMENDHELFSHISVDKNAAFKAAALSVKTKLLIGLALDAAKGSVEGVKSLALQAIEAGATKEEIFDTLRVVYYINGVGSMYTAGRALNDIF